MASLKSPYESSQSIIDEPIVSRSSGEHTKYSILGIKPCDIASKFVNPLTTTSNNSPMCNESILSGVAVNPSVFIFRSLKQLIKFFPYNSEPI